MLLLSNHCSRAPRIYSKEIIMLNCPMSPTKGKSIVMTFHCGHTFVPPSNSLTKVDPKLVKTSAVNNMLTDLEGWEGL